MAEKSLPERAQRRDSTRSIRANEQNVAQMACVLLVDVEPVRQALLGEPLMEAMLMVAWCMDHEAEPDFDAAVVLPAWAKKRKRGAWRETREPEIEQFLDTIKVETTSYEQCADCHARRRREHLWEVQAEHAEHHPGLIPGELLCDGCSRRHGIR